MKSDNNIAGMIDYERIYENLSFKDKEEPFSLVNIAPTPIVEAMMAIPDEMFDLSEPELEKLFKVDAMDEKLRTLFWLEYMRAVRTETKMIISNIFAGVCTRNYFLKAILGSTKRCLYMLTPRPDYHAEVEDILNILTKKMRAIAEMPLENKDGSLNLKAVAHITKAWETVSSKRRSLPTKKMLVGHVHAQPRQLPPSQEVQAIEDQLKQLESQTNPIPIDKPESIPESVYEEITNQEASGK